MLTDVKVLKFTLYPNFGIIATIQFLNKNSPTIGDVIEYRMDKFKIIGIVVSASSNVITNNFKENVYDCKLEKVSM